MTATTLTVRNRFSRRTSLAKRKFVLLMESFPLAHLLRRLRQMALYLP
ncbi:hypothetical protein [Actinomycetospora sp. NBRC 106375]|nr:hypothetical protein [Actinomycetospora sp. NBRC 106375]